MSYKKYMFFYFGNEPDITEILLSGVKKGFVRMITRPFSSYGIIYGDKKLKYVKDNIFPLLSEDSEFFLFPIKDIKNVHFKMNDVFKEYLLSEVEPTDEEIAETEKKLTEQEDFIEQISTLFSTGTLPNEEKLTLDQILDRINEIGYDKLTDKEKEFLKNYNQ
jgi:hypothetical protein